jgi:hypothetical protein
MCRCATKPCEKSLGKSRSQLSCLGGSGQASVSQQLRTCRQYDAWLAEWFDRNMDRIDVRADVWGRTQQAAMARYLAATARYERLCGEGGTALQRLFNARGELVRSWLVCTHIVLASTDPVLANNGSADRTA